MKIDDDRQPDSQASHLIALFSKARLSPAHRRIANHVIANPGTSIFLSSNDLATAVGVSQPSVTRLAAAIGFSSYAAFQDELRNIVLNPPDAALEPSNKFQSAIADELTNLQALSHMLDDSAEIVGLASALMTSDPLVILGLRSASGIASYFNFFASKIHPDVRLAAEPSRDVLLQAHETGAEWLLVFLLPRYPTDVAKHLALAKSLGYRIALVTDRRSSHCDAADRVVLAPVGSQLVFDSYAAPLVVANVLLEAMSDANPEVVSERLEVFERLAAETVLFSTD